MTVALSIPCMALEPSGLRPLCTGRHAGRVRVLVVARKLVVKVTAGKDEPERCNQAFTVAAAAVASGVSVSLWLTGEAAWVAPAGPGGRLLPAARGPARGPAGLRARARHCYRVQPMRRPAGHHRGGRHRRRPDRGR